MLLTVPVFLSLALIAAVSAEGEEVDAPDYNGKGAAENGGVVSGRGQTILDDMEEEKRKQQQKIMHGHGEKEVAIQAQEEAYEQWLAECVEDRIIPEIKDDVKSFLENMDMTESDLIAVCEEQRQEEGKGKRSRAKRTYMATASASTNKWDKCIVPYVFDPSLPDDWRNAVIQAHANYEKRTGFRFKPYTGDNSIYNLTHNNYLNYEDGGGCWSFVGNLKTKNGQNISPCKDMAVATHEIGHALGLHHEQHLPHSFDMLSSHFEFVADGDYGNYMRSSYSDVYNAEYETYDMSSKMSYEDWTSNKNYGQTITANDPELDYIIGTDNDFYMFRDLNKYYNCFAEFPETCTTIPTCEMGGYPSVVNGQCACICPTGLDPATNCTTKYIPPADTGPWPDGTFSLLKVKDNDCPSGFSYGRMTRWNSAWAWNGGSLHSPGYKDGWEQGHDVCTQTSSSSGGDWPSGDYCILKRGTCPDGFTEGLMETYGQAPKRENSSYGALPDGKKGQLFEYRFCCRQDGSKSTPISLPNSVPFILYTDGSWWDCQEVEGMQWVLEYYHTKSDLSAYRVKFSGELPGHYAWNLGSFNTYYCVYLPEVKNCGEVKTFTTETEYIFNTPNYPNNYPKATECMWHFKSPEGSTMKIEFPTFEVSTATDTSCSSYVELRTFWPEMAGFKFCGHGYLKWHQTVENYLTVKFVSTTKQAWKGFQAKITIIRESDKCYTGDGKDSSYAGTLDYTKNFQNCLPWKDVSCPFNQFDPAVQDVDLSNNYCRNVGTGRMPWCYTNAERCYRENCDACMIGTCFDLFDCSALIAADSQFCSKNEFNEAKRGCKQTCGFCSSHTEKTAAASVTCAAPPAVEGISPMPASSTYHTGDVVSYTCPSSNTVRTRTCTSEGTWTHLGYVCSGCPTGWTAVSGRCHKWMGWRIIQTYAEASATCSALNSHLAIVDSQEALDAITALTDFAREDTPKIWLGMSADENHAWTWDDGTAVSFAGWESGEPNNFGNNEKCADGSIAGTWNDIRCTSTTRKRQVVCTYTPPATFICEDDLPNCAKIMAATPEMCQVHSDYAWVNCRRSCAITNCPSSVTCAVTASQNAARTFGSDTLSQGQYVEYKCNTGYLRTAGDEKRVCLPTGQLSGSDLVCTATTSTTNYEMMPNVELFRRKDHGDTLKRVAIVIQELGPTIIKYAGNITAWTYYSNFDDEVAFQVWRANKNPARNTTYVFVGQNIVNPSADNRITRVEIDPAEQILVQAGDVIGLYMRQSVISFSRCESQYMPENSFWYKSSSEYSSTGAFTPGSEYRFTPSRYNCRIYSLRATLNLSA